MRPAQSEWSGLYRIEIIRDGDEATGTHDDTLGIPAVGCPARPRLIGAVDEITPAAEDTDTVGSTEKADADAPSNTPSRHAVANRIDMTNDFMPWDTWVVCGTVSLNSADVAVANAAGLDGDTNVAGSGFHQRALCHFEPVGATTCTAR